MNDSKSNSQYSNEVLEELKLVRRNVAEIVSSKLARGNFNLQHGYWPSEEKWEQRKQEHPDKLEFLLNEIRVKQ